MASQIQPQTIADRAIKADESGDKDLAFELYNEFLAAYEEKPQAEWCEIAASCYNNRGVIFMKDHKYSKALTDYNNAVRLAPTALHYNNRSNCFRQLKQYPEAKADLATAIGLDPNFVGAHLNMFLVLIKLRDSAGAWEYADKAVALDSHRALGYFYRGIGHWELGKSDKALADFRDALILGLSAENKEQAEEAEQICRELDPDYYQTWDSIVNKADPSEDPYQVVFQFLGSC